MIMDISKSNTKASDNKQNFEIPKFWYKTKSLEYPAFENLRINNPMKTNFKAIIEENGALKNMSRTVIKVDAKRMVL